MKSLLCEASSVIKAIESAWKQSGKPSEFTIKILEPGEKGILWFAKHPAIISMSYDPKKQTIREAITSSKKESSTPSTNSQQRKKKVVEHTIKPQHTSSGKGEHQRTDLRKTTPTTQPQQISQQQKKETQKQPEQIPLAPAWNEALVSDVTQWLEETISILQGNAKFAANAEKKTLRITLDQYIIPNSDENKSLHISLGNLFMQALKKKHKKKLQGFNIIITLKSTPNNENKKSDASI